MRRFGRFAFLAVGAVAGAGALRLLAGPLFAGSWALRRAPVRPRASVAGRGLKGFAQQVTFVYVRDLQRGSEFYGSLLGLRPVLDQTPPGEANPLVRIFEVTPSAYIGLCERDAQSLKGTGVAEDGVILCLVSDEVDEWAERLRMAGVAIEKPPTFNPRYNIYHMFVRDPDGHLVEIQEFRDPAWPRSSSSAGNRLLVVAKGRAEGCDEWPIWSCPALPDPSGRFQESRWWESRPGAAEERCLILSGRAILTTPDGRQTTIEAGDWVVFKKGFTCIWEVEQNISKRYSYFTADGAPWSPPSI